MSGPFSQGVAYKMGEWHSFDGEAVCHWGVIEGSDGPALIITNDRDEPQHIIPVNAMRSLLGLFDDKTETSSD